VDVSKNFFSACGHAVEGKELFSGTYQMDSNGFSEFLKKTKGARSMRRAMMRSIGLSLGIVFFLFCGGFIGKLRRKSFRTFYPDLQQLTEFNII
jgi:hypothetical protein